MAFPYHFFFFKFFECGCEIVHKMQIKISTILIEDDSEVLQCRTNRNTKLVSFSFILQCRANLSLLSERKQHNKTLRRAKVALLPLLVVAIIKLDVYKNDFAYH